MKILIFGASGSGTTTLGNEIERIFNFKHLDIDDFYWKKTVPPFQEKIPLTERNNNLKEDFNKYDNVVVSGSLVSWGNEWLSAFDLAIFIRIDNELRMSRLKEREVERYGSKLLTDVKAQNNLKAFLEWANEYENPNFNGRSLRVHNNWMKLLDCEILKLDGSLELSKKVELVKNHII